jgi:hypothetical protein
MSDKEDEDMEKIDIILWVIGIGFTFLFGLMLVMWTHLSSLMKDLNRKMDDTNAKVSEVDKRLYGVETVLHMKDCCVLKQDQNLKRVE